MPPECPLDMHNKTEREEEEEKTRVGGRGREEFPPIFFKCRESSIDRENI